MRVLSLPINNNKPLLILPKSPNFVQRDNHTKKTFLRFPTIKHNVVFMCHIP